MYVRHKAHLARYYDTVIETSQKKVIRFRENAEKLIKIILQKKLFNLQLLWRAEQIQIKEISFSSEFRFWAEHISDCPFIPPVTQQELEVMKKFYGIENYDYILSYSAFEWQDYRILTKKMMMMNTRRSWNGMNFTMDIWEQVTFYFYLISEEKKRSII
ncbi:MAG: hypothetical protein HC830_06620 [Bacteroidetes bacterium]|nr:hypothetical protein [Bacteroidota bacterium]